MEDFVSQVLTQKNSFICYAMPLILALELHITKNGNQFGKME